MRSHLIESLATTDDLKDVFSDESLTRALLDFEVALARAEAHARVIPRRAASTIAAAARRNGFDPQAIARDARTSGTPVIPVVRMLTDRVRAVDPKSAGFVHWGATSQDAADSAMALTLKRALVILGAEHRRLERGLRRLSDRHAGSVMLGRTLLQPAPPITFGLKTAGWYAMVVRAWRHLSRSGEEALVIQFGGASGTLAALGRDGLIVGANLARELGLRFPDAPWHAHRDRLAAFIASCGVYCGSLGKIARDVSLLMQHEVGEATEPGGGSSTMPHKRNPTGCAIVLAAATRMPGLVASFLSAMVQEHERSAGGWHAEWPVLASAVKTTGAALTSMAELIEDLEVDSERMRANLEATGGLVFAERVMMMLAPTVGRDVAHRLVGDAVGRSQKTGITFAEALRRIPEALRAHPELLGKGADASRAMSEVERSLAPERLREVDLPEDYLGMAEAFRKRQLRRIAKGRRQEANGRRRTRQE